MKARNVMLRVCTAERRATHRETKDYNGVQTISGVLDKKSSRQKGEKCLKRAVRKGTYHVYRKFIIEFVAP